MPTSDTEPGSYFVSNYPPFDSWTQAGVADAQAAFDQGSPQNPPLGLYLHIPFCRKRCKFCYFRVYTDMPASDVERYSKALVAEAMLVAAKPAIAGRRLSYVYFGGGTPSFLSVRQLERLVEGLHESFGWEHAKEVTFECEPGTLSEPKLRALKALGVTRLSLGVENFDDAILSENGRAHLSAEIMKSWEWIQSIGFSNTNVDLIAGMVGETTESWHRTVERTLSLQADSVTIYQMELPLNTVYAKDLLQGTAQSSVADWQTKRSWVDWAFSRFIEAGYSISSAYTLVRDPTKVAFQYRDMLWQGSDLAALGVASFGHMSGVHYQNASHWDEYLAAVEGGVFPITRGLKPSQKQLLIRELVLGLKKGSVNIDRLEKKFGINPMQQWASQWMALQTEGYIESLGRCPTLSRRGLLEVDRLLPRFFETASTSSECLTPNELSVGE